MISFIVPAYNEESSISNCLTAIDEEIRRSGIIAEIIVINNGSTDDTGVIVRSLVKFIRDLRVVYEPQQGLVWARQRGFMEAQYDYIANIDADTNIPPGWIDKAIKVMADFKVVVVSGPFVYYDMGLAVRMASKFFYLIGYISHNLIGPMVQGGNFVVRKQALQMVGGYDTNIEFFGEDTTIAKRLAKVGKIKFHLNFWAGSSGRRLIKDGMITTTIRYSINYLWITWFDKPFTSMHSDIRLK
jgi:glycosyltransferase involved in cell wall biosynthesis